MSRLSRLLEEPPFRLASYFFVKHFAKSIRVVERWGAVSRPHYLAGVLAAADQAVREGVKEISVFEFGVAGGNGLLALQACADAVERETGVKIQVFGFDTGAGLPDPCKDYRDHPDQWRAGDYRMDVQALQKRLMKRNSLVLGNVRDTVPVFAAEGHPPVGFVSCDVDLYSSSRDVLQILSHPRQKKLQRVFLYFDDVDFTFNHRFAGELLAIQEFNQSNDLIKIDRWRGIRKGRVFSEEPWLDSMFVAHDLAAINQTVLSRGESLGCTLT